MVVLIAFIVFVVALVIMRPTEKYDRWNAAIGLSIVAGLIAALVALVFCAIPTKNIYKQGDWEPAGESTTYTVAEGSQVSRQDDKISFIAETNAGLQSFDLNTKENTYLEVRSSDAEETRVTISTEKLSYGRWFTPWITYVERTSIILEN